MDSSFINVKFVVLKKAFIVVCLSNSINKMFFLLNDVPEMVSVSVIILFTTKWPICLICLLKLKVYKRANDLIVVMWGMLIIVASQIHRRELSIDTNYAQVYTWKEWNSWRKSLVSSFVYFSVHDEDNLSLWMIVCQNNLNSFQVRCVGAPLFESLNVY